LHEARVPVEKSTDSGDVKVKRMSLSSCRLKVLYNARTAKYYVHGLAATIVQSYLARGRIAVLSPLAAADEYIHPPRALGRHIRPP